MDLIAIDRELATGLQATLEASRMELERLRQSQKPDSPMSLSEAYQYLGVSRSTLSTYIERGEIRASQYGSRVWVMRSEIDRFLERHRRK